MSRHGYGHSSGSLEGAMGSLIGLCIVLAVIAFVLLVRATVSIVQTFVKYRKDSKGLWYSLWVFCGSCILAGLLYVLFRHQEFAAIAYAGFLQLFLVCKIVQTQHSQTLMKQNYHVMSDILRKNWWSSENTPIAA